MINRLIRTRYSILVIFIVTVLVSTVAIVQNAYATELEASGTCGENLTWELDSAGTLTISGTGDMAYSSSNAPWYDYWTDIEAIVISEGVTSICGNAFNKCGLAESITIPKSLKRIDYYAFKGCGFKKVYISDLKCYLSISMGSHWDQNNPTLNGAELYLDGSIVEDLVIPDGITIIPEACLEGCTSIKTVTIPEGVTTINRYAFVNCSNIKSIRFPKSLSNIYAYAFSGCNIEEVYISDLASYLSITYESGGNIYPLNYYGADICIDNAEPGVIMIPDTVISIPDKALMNVSANTIIIPEGVKNIGASAFAYCKNLTSITIPNTVKSIGGGAFCNCENLTSITIPSTVKRLTGFIGCSSLSKVVIPEGVEIIANSAFADCNGLEEISIPSSVTTIEGYAFFDCTSLQRVYIPESVITIQDHAFDSVSGTFYVKKDSYAEQYLIDKGKTIEYYCFGDHVWDTEYTVDKEATCTEEGSESIHCSVCGEKDNTTVRAIDKKPHAYGDWTTVEEATCTADGSKEKVCEVCEDKVTEVIPATGHSFSDEFTTDTEPTCTAEGSKSKHCTKCNAVTEVTAIPANGHTFGPWEEVTPSTCEGAGSHQHRCEVCGFTEAEATDPTGHDIEENYTIDVPATCTEDGSQSKHCKNCEVTFDSQVIPATGHNYGEWKTTLEPTCTEKGSKEQICSSCKDKVTQDIHALGHVWNEEPTVEKEATCTETGSQSIHCARCNETRDAETIPALGHDWSTTPTVDKKATCTEDGKESTHCTRCDAVQEGSEKAIPATGHKFSSWTTTKKATEIAAGQQTRKCSVCGKTETKTVAQLKPTLPAVNIATPKAAKKSATIKWKKVNKANQKKIASIQVQYSLDKSFKTGVKTVTAKKTAASKKITKLTSKKTYYVRIRAYKKSGGAVHVSKWSAVKKVKAK